ncbi:MAG: metal-sensitive transcriptional regulator [Actinobacteria bacterium]|jgi:DNA-binding FrmR family transcriptional regulator|nr:metal-sensitive transcriptional regulator [Actinomycetota bacterium]
MQIPAPITQDVQRRIARAEGQLRGIQAMLADERDCRDVVAQLTAVERAIHRARLRLLTAGIRYCAQDPALGEDADEFEALLLRSS